MVDNKNLIIQYMYIAAFLSCKYFTSMLTKIWQYQI